MSADHTALMRAIRDAPEDDLPRLALADYLEENDHPERAELIRTQIDLARLSLVDPRRRELEDREHALLTAHEREWIAPFLDTEMPSRGLLDWSWERGFVNEITAAPVFLRDRGAELLAAHPFRRWRVLAVREERADDLLEAARQPWIAHLTSLDVRLCNNPGRELDLFLTSPMLANLRELDLTRRHGLAAIPELLGRAPYRNRLRVLRCSQGPGPRLDTWALVRALPETRLIELSLDAMSVTAGALRAILAAPLVEELTTLNVRDNPELEPDAWDTFRHTRCRLQSVDLSGTPVGAITLDDALGTPGLADLRSLGLDRCGSAMMNFRALERSRFWRQAEELRMSNGTAPERAFEPVFNSPGPPGLRTLDLSQNYLYDSGVGGLCAAAWAGPLSWLDLSQNYLTDEAARTIADCGRFTHLRELHLSYNHPDYQDDEEGRVITEAGAFALAEARSLANLRVLALNGTRMSPAAIDTIINGPHWQLSELELAWCGLTPAAIRVLAESPRLARLARLVLSNNPLLPGDALLPLAQSEYLSPRTELCVRCVAIDPGVRQLLRDRLGPRLNG